MNYIELDKNDDIYMSRLKIRKSTGEYNLKKLYVVGLPIEFLSDKKILQIRRSRELFPSIKIEGRSSLIEELIQDFSL